MKVRRLPKDPGPAAWNDILPARRTSSPLEGSTTADWIIIGGGFAGLAAARRLSQNCPGDKIAVLEAKGLAEGPAGRNSGFMIDLPHDLASEDYGGDLEPDRLQIQDNRLGIQFATEMAQDFGMSKEVFDPSGKYTLAASDHGFANNRAFAGHLDGLGEPYTELNSDECQRLTGTTYYKQGLHTPGAVMIQPAAFIRTAAKGIASNRVQIYENSPVTSLEKQGDWVATTDTGRITAPKVILAVNGHLNNFGFARGRLMHIFTYASMTRRLTQDEVARLGGVPNWGTTPADPMGTTVRRISGSAGDRIIIRNRATFDPSIEVTDRRIARVAQDHDAAFAARFPMLDGVEMDYRWGGRLCLTLNNVQMIGELDDGLYSACVQNGLGTAKGTLAGLLAADLACGKQSEALDRALTAPAPKRLPPEPFALIGANIRMRWGEWKAGKEL